MIQLTKMKEIVHKPNTGRKRNSFN